MFVHLCVFVGVAYVGGSTSGQDGGLCECRDSGVSVPGGWWLPLPGTEPSITGVQRYFLLLPHNEVLLLL